MITEDGSIVSGANTYVTISDFKGFLSVRGIDSSAHEDDELGVMLIRSMDYLYNLDYIGVTVGNDQELPFPRSGVYLANGRLFPATAIPKDLKQAQMWLAYYIGIEGIDLSAAPTDKVVREKVDVLEIEYSRAGNDNKNRALSLMDLPNVQMCLKYLVNGDGQSANGLGSGRIDRA